jgi:hypothetical protein
VRACLQKQGVTLPNRQPGQAGGPGGGQPPAGATGGQGQGGQQSARFQKLRAALQKCGVKMPQGGGPGGGQAPSGTGASN